MDTNGDDNSAPNSSNSNRKTNDHLDAEKDEHKPIKIGRKYQAIIPPLVPLTEQRRQDLPEKALCVWTPPENIPDGVLDDYITFAKRHHDYERDQALALLYWYNYDTELAIQNMGSYVPLQDTWSEAEILIFDRAYAANGSNFHAIQQMLPDKSMGEIIQFYYKHKPELRGLAANTPAQKKSGGL